LNSTGKSVRATFDPVHIVVGQLTPLLPYAAFDDLPLSLDLILVHVDFLLLSYDVA
jgi:hypothetical protein